MGNGPGRYVTSGMKSGESSFLHFHNFPRLFTVIFFLGLSLGTQVQRKALTVVKKKVSWAWRKKNACIIEAKVFPLVNSSSNPNAWPDVYSVIHLFSTSQKWFITMERRIIHQGWQPCQIIQWYPTVLSAHSKARTMRKTLKW